MTTVQPDTESRESRRSTFVLCIRNDGYPASLEVRKLYRLLPSAPGETGFLRVIDESGEDYLYPDSFFAVVDLPEAIERALAISGGGGE